ncbi:MAG: glycosyltransferase family 4 protein [Phycisphaerae bacterium]|nr:glycosyltransferase family 4 protein [Phycisphaerae bacterium]
MLKVAIIIERAEIGLGGGERSVSELAAELRRQGVAATILAAKGTSSENTEILCGDHAGKRVPLKVFEDALRNYLKKNTYDIIHSTLPLSIADIYQPRGGSYREAMLQNIASYSCPCQRFFKRRTHFLNLKRTQYLNAEKQLCAKTNATIAALSKYVKAHFQKHYHLPDSRIAVIANGINTNIKMEDDLITDLGRRVSLYCMFEIPNKQNMVSFVFAANNPRLKGLESLLNAFSSLVNQQKDIFPVLIVAGSKGLGYCDHLVKRLKLGKHVHSIHAERGIWTLLSGCDVAVLPTWYDPCSRFILEALAMGKPVITTRFNGASERYEHQKHGIILDQPDNIVELTAALNTFCDRKKIELASKAIVEDNLKEEVSIMKHVRMLIGLYDTIVARKEK